MTIRQTVLRQMLAHEERASKAFDKMSSQEKQAYLRAHPGSHMGGHSSGNRPDQSAAKWPHHAILKKAGLDHVATENGKHVYEHEGTGDEVHVNAQDGSWTHHEAGRRHGSLAGRGSSAKDLHHHISGYYDEDD